VAQAARRLEAKGYQCLDEAEPWELEAGGGYYVVRGGSSLIAFRLGERPLAEAGYRMVGAHTDSPGLRVKPRAGEAKGGLGVLGVEVYGSPILATFTDRDLTLAGRVQVRGSSGPAERLLHFERPLVRLPNLAVHMNRSVNEEGLRLDRHQALPLLLEGLREEVGPAERFRTLVAERLEVAPEDVVAWNLAVADTQPGSLWGPGEAYIADSQLDNLASVHAAVEALPGESGDFGAAVVACYDHEEVGSESDRGAASDFLEAVLARIAEARGLDADDQARALARSWLLSADGAHAYHPHYPAYHDDQYPVRVNGGPVVKINAAQRYMTDDRGEALFGELCRLAGVEGQTYVHRGDLPCGSTIGPLLAARLGVATLDAGLAMWAMHSLRESAGAEDPAALTALCRVFLNGEAE
jgi:aspartyl aminopeptidase